MTAWQLPYRVIFMHVPKTAGTTLRTWFQSQLHRGVYFPNIVGAPDAPVLRYLREEVDTFPLARSDHRSQVARWNTLTPQQQHRTHVFVGHFFYGIHEQLPGPARYMTIVRDPVDRVLSLYAHRVEHHGLHVPLERYLTTERDWEISNGHTRRLSSSGLRDCPGDVTPAMFDVACARLQECAAVGVTERFDETILAFADLFGWGTPGYDSTNQSKRRVGRKELSGDLLDRLLDRNQYDLQLHALANKLLDERLSGLDVDTGLHQLRRSSRIVHYRAVPRARLRSMKVLGGRITRAALRRPQS